MPLTPLGVDIETMSDATWLAVPTSSDGPTLKRSASWIEAEGPRATSAPPPARGPIKKRRPSPSRELVAYPARGGAAHELRRARLILHEGLDARGAVIGGRLPRVDGDESDERTDLVHEVVEHPRRRRLLRATEAPKPADPLDPMNPALLSR